MSDKRGLGDILVDEHLIAPEQLKQAQRAARRLGSPVVSIFIDQGLVDEEDMLEALRHNVQMPEFDPAGTVVDPDVVRVVPYEEAIRYRLLPVQIAQSDDQRVLRVAMADPLDAQAIEDIEFTTGATVEPLIALHSHLEEAIRTHYRGIVTKVIPRQRQPMPAAAREPDAPRKDPATNPYSRHPRLAEVETKQFLHLAAATAEEARVEALVNLLIRKGVIDQEEYQEELHLILNPKKS